MPIPEFSTWDGDEETDPYRPAVVDLGGDELEDDATEPPIEGEMPTAGGHNQTVKQIVGMARVIDCCKFDVRYDSGDPFIYGVAAPGGNVTVDTFTVTDNGVGDTTIEWPANTFPSGGIGPTGLTVIHSAAPSSFMWHICQVLSNGFRVRTGFNGVAADLDFTICVNSDT